MAGRLRRLIATEWLLVATILVIGVITGLVAVRQAVLTELENVAAAVGSLSQAYSFSGQANCQASTAGSQFGDEPSSTPLRLTPASQAAAAQTPCD